MKKLKIAVATLGLCMLMTPQTVLAGQWKTDANGWWYQNDDGSYPANCWQWIDGNGDGSAIILMNLAICLVTQPLLMDI